MTEKLFYTDAYVEKAECVITDVIPDGKNIKLILNKTPFFPEGGGQECDRGTINGSEVISVTEENGNIYHKIHGNAEFHIGETVTCIADAKKRFARMQAHSGEHIVSGIAHSLYGTDNTGFHMDDTVMTVDFNLPLTDDDIKKIEEEANATVWKNLPITTRILKPEDAEKIEYRSKKAIPDNIRLVTIKGIDCCACCAPHVRSTGEIGLILITSKVSHRGGVRITLVCGETAFRLAAQSYSQVKEMAEKLVVARTEAVEGLDAYIKKSDEVRLEKNLITDRLCRTVADSVEINCTNTVVLCSLTPDEMTKTGSMLLKKTDNAIIMLSGSDENGYNYVITAKNNDLKKIANAANSALNGRGGGNNEMIRGRFSADINTIRQYFGENEL